MAIRHWMSLAPYALGRSSRTRFISRGIVNAKGILRYSSRAALIAAAGLVLIYVCYISMGAHTLEHSASNGMQIMSAYVETVSWCIWPRVVGGNYYAGVSGHGDWFDDRNRALFSSGYRDPLWPAGNVITGAFCDDCRTGAGFADDAGGSGAECDLSGGAGGGGVGNCQ